MKKIMILVLLLPAFFSCDKNENKVDNLQFIETIPGGCAIDETKSLKSALIEQDTVTYSITDGELDIKVGFNATCCGEYYTSSIIKNDTIFIDIQTSKIGLCNCICYYTYDFKYSGISDNYNYKIAVDDYLFFNGLIEP